MTHNFPKFMHAQKSFQITSGIHEMAENQSLNNALKKYYHKNRHFSVWIPSDLED